MRPALPEILHARRHPTLATRTCLLVPTWLLIQGQPSIWRRVYRRDFLDNRNIWFPEHIRAFDDQIFQLLTLQHVPDVPMLDGVHYLYRQHPAQDIKQGDERHFYSLEMFRLVFKRGISEGWNDFPPVDFVVFPDGELVLAQSAARSAPGLRTRCGGTLGLCRSGP